MLLQKKDNCPYLLLAPMEGVGDLSYRKAMQTIGGMDEMCSEFIRVPTNAHIPSLVKQYNPNDTTPIPQAAQIMGAEPKLMAEMAQALEKRGAPRIDLNCGCPSNRVTGRGAGSSLLKEPKWLYEVAKAMVEAVDIPVTAKLRSGFSDISLFKENLLAAQEAGIAYLTLHPRTKLEGYKPPAHWDLIAKAKELLTIPVVGNGDIFTKEDALRMLKETNCDALMIGRGAIRNPWLFHEIRSHYSGIPTNKSWAQFELFLDTFLSSFPERIPIKTRINKCKQLFGFLFQQTESLLARRQEILRHRSETASEYVATGLTLYRASLDKNPKDTKLT